MATTIIGVDGCDLRGLVPGSNFDGGAYPAHGALDDCHICGMETKEAECSPLHHFDFSEIDSGDTIAAASLFFYCVEVWEQFGFNNEDYTYAIYRCLKDAYVTDPDYDDWLTSEATWQIAHNGTPYAWETEGCKGVTDRTATHFAPYTGPSADGCPKWVEVDVLDMVNDVHPLDQILNVLNCGHQTLLGQDDFLSWRYHSYTAATNKPYLELTVEGAPPEGGSRNQAYVMGSRLGGVRVLDLPRGWRRRPELRGLLVPAAS